MYKRQPVEFAVLAELFAIEANAKARCIGDGNRSVLVAQAAAFDDVVRQMMIMRIRGEREIG